MLTAIEFGERYNCCEIEMIWRRSLPPETTQAEAYLLCQRGDWLAWQLVRNYANQEEIDQALQRAATKIAARAIRCVVKSLRGNRNPWTTKYRAWARRWLSGEDRSVSSANAAAYFAIDTHPKATLAITKTAANAAANAAYSAASASNADAYLASIGASSAAADASAYVYLDAEAARKKEKHLQVYDIKSEIPEWPPEWSGEH